jgi:hypothetical protein
MHYALPQHLSFCRVGKGLVFLDTCRDRYFRLSPQLERAFLSPLQGASDLVMARAALIERGILVASSVPTHPSAPCLPAASRSAIESASRQDGIPMSMLLNVFSSVGLMRQQLGTRRLEDILRALAEYRQRKTSRATNMTGGIEEVGLARIANQFLRARAYVPIQPRCLLDSLAMVRVLAQRGLRVNLVFGVTDDPFTAHAWVQAGDLVLSDTVGHATAHVPIRVV